MVPPDYVRKQTLVNGERYITEALKEHEEKVLGAEERRGELENEIFAAETSLRTIKKKISGSPSMGQVGEKEPPTPGNRFSTAMRGMFTTYGPTEMQKTSLEIGKKALAAIKTDLSSMVEDVLPGLESKLKQAGAPWIEGQGLIQ